jgi:conjugal transfer pilus assembly protein TraF
MAKFLWIILLLLFPLHVLANDFYDQHETGWYWFDDPKKVEKNTNMQLPKNKSLTPSEEVNFARKKLKEALDKAILNPTIENLASYKRLQDQLSERANQFANMWQKMILNHPELNYSLEHPTNNVGLKVYHEMESQKKVNAVHEFSRQSGLFFFYRSTCPYCQRFAPILKHFAENYHIAVVPITMDGISLPEFPNSKIDNGVSKQFHVSVEPSLYAVNPKTQKAFPIAFGLTSESELLDNIYNIMTNYRAGL